MKLTPAFEQLAGEYSVKCKALKFFGVNTQMAPDLASQFELTTIPTFIIWHRGTQVDRLEGDNLEKLKEAIAKLKEKLG